MKLYPRRLRDIEELEREKNMLKEMQKLNEENSPFSVGSILGMDSSGKAKKNKKDKSDDEGGSFLDGLSSVSPIISIASKIVPLFTKNKTGKAAGAIANAGGTAMKVAGKVVKDVAFSYVKWKAIELGLKGIRKFIQARKDKHLAEK